MLPGLSRAGMLSGPERLVSLAGGLESPASKSSRPQHRVTGFSRSHGKAFDCLRAHELAEAPGHPELMPPGPAWREAFEKGIQCYVYKTSERRRPCLKQKTI